MELQAVVTEQGKIIAENHRMIVLVYHGQQWQTLPMLTGGLSPPLSVSVSIFDIDCCDQLFLWQEQSASVTCSSMPQSQDLSTTSSP